MKPLAAGRTAERGKAQFLEPIANVVSSLEYFTERDGFPGIEIEDQPIWMQRIGFRAIRPLTSSIAR